MNILIAPKVRETFRVMLERAGCEVAEAGDGEEGIRAFRAGRPDVVVCDLFMPGRDGLELIRDLRREAPDARIVAMSGGGFGDTLDMLPVAQRLGAAVLYKPFTQAAALAQRLRRR